MSVHDFSWDVYQRNDFHEPRLLHLPIYRKALNTSTWHIWFSFNLLRFGLPAFCCKLLYNLSLPPLPPWSSFLRILWDATSQAWSSKNSRQIKHNSQLLGCEYFWSRQWERLACIYMRNGKIPQLDVGK